MKNRFINTGLYSISSIILLFLTTVIVQAQGSESVKTSIVPMDLPAVNVGQNGNLEASIPLTIVAGTGGLTPQLAISYSGGSQGLLSNWDLTGLPLITAERGKNNSFIAVPGGRLIRATDGSYRTEVDSAAIYTRVGDCNQGECYWSVRQIDGSIVEFGTSAATRVTSVSGTTIFWGMDRIKDLRSNYLTVSYERSGGKLYPKSIVYGLNNALPDLVVREIEFHYTTQYSGANNTTVAYLAGRRADSDRYMTAISSSYNGREIYRYNFNYAIDTYSGQVRLTSFSEEIEENQVRTPLNFNYEPTTIEYNSTILDTDTGVGTPDQQICEAGSQICLLLQYNLIHDPTMAAFASSLCTAYQLTGEKECQTGNTWNTGDFNGDGLTDFVGAIDKYSGNGQSITILEISAGELGVVNVKDHDERGLEKGSGFYMDFNGDGYDDYIRLWHGIENFNDIYAFSVSNGTPEGQFIESHLLDGLQHGMGLGYDSNALKKQLLLMWLGEQYNKQLQRKTLRMGTITAGMATYGAIFGGVGGALSGALTGAAAGRSFYGRMGNSQHQALLLGELVMGQSSGADAFAQFADLNGDGLQDYVRLVSSNEIAVALNNGTGFYTDVKSQVDPGIALNSSVTGSATIKPDSGLTDLNEDGVVDETDLAILPAEEQGDHLAISTTITSNGFRGLGDFNGDGVPDFVALVKDGIEFKLKIHYGARNGSFATGIMSSSLDPGISAFRMLVDINSDGYSDFVRLSQSQEELLISYGSGVGLGLTVASYVGLSASQGRSLGDVNGDGKFDFVRFIPNSSGGYSAQARLFRGQGFDGLDIDLNFSAGPRHLNLNPIFVTDVSGDGRADLLVPYGGRLEIVTSGGKTGGLLESISNGYQHFDIKYSTAVESGAVKSQNNRRENGASILANRLPRYLVSAVELHGKSGPSTRTTYSFENDLIKIGPTPKSSRALGPQQLTVRNFVYHNGKWESAPTYSIQKFHQLHPDPTIAHRAAGMVARSEVRRSDNDGLVTEENYHYSIIQTASTASEEESYRIYPASIESIDYSTTAQIATLREVKTVDSYGNPTCKVEYGDLASKGDDRSIVTSYDYPTEVPYGRPKTTEIYTGTTCSDGNLVSYQSLTYDSNGNVIKQSSGLSPEHTVSTAITYDFVGNVLTKTRLKLDGSSGLTTRMEYDDATASYVVSIIDPAENMKTMSYNLARGQIVSATDENEATIHNEYDLLGRIVATKVEADGSGSHIINTIDYDHYSDGSTVITSKDLLTGNISSGVVKESVEHSNEWGVLLKSIVRGESGDIVTIYTYDKFDREIARSIPHFSGETSPGEYSTTYDYLGRITSTSRPGADGNTLTITRNPGELHSIKFTSSVVNGSGVELKGYAILETKPNGQQIYQYNTRDGKLIQSEYQTEFVETAPAPGNGSGNTTVSAPSKKSGWIRIRYHYDEQGRVVKVTRGTSTVRNSYSEDVNVLIIIHFDDYGRVIETDEPDRGVTIYTYNDLHKPKCSTFGDGKTICREYDSYGRLIALHKDSLPDKNSPADEALATYTYGEESENNGMGRLISRSDASGVLKFQYDALSGKVSRIERNYTLLGDPRSFDIELHYSPSGVLLNRTFSTTNLTLGYSYFKEGNLKAIQLGDPDGNILKDGSVIPLYEASTPDAMGNSTTINYPNGVELNNTFDNKSGVRTAFSASNRNANKLLDLNYIYNNEALIVQKNDNLMDDVDASESFTYDIVRRLTSANGPYGNRTAPVGAVNYYYGKDGQLYNRNGSWAFYKANEPHKLENLNNISYGYDHGPGNGRGNVVSRTISASRGKPNIPPNPFGQPPEGVQPGPGSIIQSITYSYLNRIERITANGPLGKIEANYIYDVNGERFQKIVSGDPLNSNGTTVTTQAAVDYKIETSGGGEIHTYELRIGHTLAGRFSFQPSDLTAYNGGTAGHHYNRLLSYGGKLFSVEVAHLPGNLTGFIKSANALLKLMPAYVFNSIFWSLFLITALITAIILARLWSREREKNYILRLPLMRSVSLLLVVTFYMNIVSCGLVSTNKNPLLSMSGNGKYAKICRGDENLPHAYKTGELGAYYYISTLNGSNEVVTDGCGSVVQKNYFLPYGKLNRELSKFDPDGDNMQYRGSINYTGHELDTETGLYNMKARMYDAETTRFLGADPVHTELAGYDSYDRYQYVNANPVNMIDPDGKTGCFPKTMYGHNYSGPSACSKTERKMFVKMLEHEVMLRRTNTPPNVIHAIQLAYYLNNKPKNPLTELDKNASYPHDNNGFANGYGSFKHKEKTLNADIEWLKNAYKTMFTPVKYWKNTYEREYNAVPDQVERRWGNTGRIIAAIGGSILSFTSDAIVLILGTILFGLTTVPLYAFAIAIERHWKRIRRGWNKIREGWKELRRRRIFKDQFFGGDSPEPRL